MAKFHKIWSHWYQHVKLALKCDQMARSFVYVWPFTTLKNLPNSNLFFAKAVSKFCRVLNKPKKNFSGIINLLPFHER